MNRIFYIMNKIFRSYIRELVIETIARLSPEEKARQKIKHHDLMKNDPFYAERTKQRDFANLSSNPNLLTGQKISQSKSGGNDISSIVGVFDDLEDYIKSSDIDSMKRVTLDVPKENVKSSLDSARKKLLTFAQALGTSAKSLEKSYEKNADSTKKYSHFEDDLKKNKNVYGSLQALIDSTFDALTK